MGYRWVNSKSRKKSKNEFDNLLFYFYLIQKLSKQSKEIFSTLVKVSKTLRKRTFTFNLFQFFHCLFRTTPICTGFSKNNIST